AGGWQLRTRPAYADAINASMALPNRRIDFTRTELLVLVSIAYHQPITRAGVDAGSGATEEAARTRLKANYLYAAGKITNAEWFKTTSS
ncbi:hypothetical protein EOA13_37175, partial [Mesorhizobium sp. M7A.F.Ca.US.011.01.1.1]|uniref:SMC-Scp complex subunit ScpB n=1 Tax=Mesorhizobium sp. M7A.F.Ca.US.011.01.1.1 TaxID=2496741 RepID=UPI000FD4B29F